MKKGVKAAVVLLVLLTVCLSCVQSISALPKKLVVGCFTDKNYFEVNDDGTYSGYLYDYLSKLAKVGSYSFEYKIGTFDECLNFLKNGEVDFISDIEKSDERLSDYLFPNEPMSTCRTYLFTSGSDASLASEDYGSYNGITIGTVRGSINRQRLEAFAQSKGFSYKEVIYDSYTDVANAVQNGEIDAGVADSMADYSDFRIISTVNTQDEFFVTAKDNEELCDSLNLSLTKLKAQNPYFVNELYNKYYNGGASKPAFTKDELDYIQNSPTIKLAYNPFDAPMEYRDSKGLYAGTGKYVYDYISKCSGLNFSFECGDSITDSGKLFKDGTVSGLTMVTDLANPDFAEGTKLSEKITSVPIVMISSSGGSTNDIVALQKDSAVGKLVSEPLNKDKVIYFDTMEQCCKAVADNKAGSTYANTYVANYVLASSDYKQLSFSGTNYSQSIYACFSEKCDDRLLSIIDKCINSISEKELAAVSLSESSLLHEGSIWNYIANHPAESIYFISGVSLTAFIILLLIISRSHRRRRELNELRKFYETSTENVELFMWEYNISANTTTLLDNPYTRRKSEELHIPHSTKKGKEDFLHIVYPPDRKQFEIFCDEVYKGSEKCICTLRISPCSEDPLQTVRLTCTAILESGRKPRKSCGTAQNITMQAAAEDHYMKERARYDAPACEGLLAHGHYNLTKNVVINYKAFDNAAPSIKPFTDYDGCFDSYFEVLNVLSDGYFLSDMLSSKKLIEEFTAGKTNLSYDFTENSPKSGTAWRRVDSFLCSNPSTGDIESFSYIFDNTKEHLNQMLIRRLTELDYDYIGIIDTKSRTATFRGSAFPPEFGTQKDTINYDICTKNTVLKHVPENEQEETLRLGAIENILSELEKHGKFSFDYNYRENGKTRRKRLQFCYMDKSQKSVFFCRSDINSQYLSQKKQLKQMSEALEKAKNASLAKTEFVSRISHDIRTPISAITGMTAFALEDMDNPQKLKADLENIKSSSTFLLSLINDILDISKIDSGIIELHPQAFPFTDFIGNVKNTFYAIAAEKKLKLSIDTDSDGSVAMIDPIRLNQIVLNLVSNAMKYSPENGSLDIFASCREIGSGKVLCIGRIRDNGIGMSEGFQKVMFEPFTQDENNPERLKLSRGTGLGLSIVKRIVDLMGGTINVKSSLNEGTEITVSLILPQATEENILKENENAEKIDETKLAPLEGKVLLAEDNRINTEIALRLLNSFGVDIVLAENGKMALEIFKNSAIGEFSAVLMDIQMPFMDGYEATAAIRSLDRSDKNVPVIAMTADAFMGAMQKCLNAGMNEYLTKPLSTTLLYKTLKKYLKRK